MFSDMCLFFVRVWSPYLFSHFYCSFPLFRLYWFVLWKGFDTSCGDFSVFLYATCANLCVQCTNSRSRCCRDRMVVAFTTTYATSASHH